MTFERFVIESAHVRDSRVRRTLVFHKKGVGGSLTLAPSSEMLHNVGQA